MRARTLPLVLAAIAASTHTVASADVFRWDTGVICPGTANMSPMPEADFSNFNTPSKNLIAANLVNFDLTQANFKTADLSSARFSNSTLTSVLFSNANLSSARLGNSNALGANFHRASLSSATLTGSDLRAASFANANLYSADFSYSILEYASLAGANVTHASFNNVSNFGFTPNHLYYTASYQNRDLTGIRLNTNDLAGWNFASQNLFSASFANSAITAANFTGATVRHVSFLGTSGFTAEQLHSTASYQNRDLTGISLYGHNLTSWNFTSQNLSSADLRSSTLTATNFTDATVQHADLYSATSHGFTAAQLYSTASYKNRDLTGVRLSRNNLAGWNFTSQNLSSADLSTSNLTNAIFIGATVAWADLPGATSMGFTAAQLYSTASYQNHDLTGIDLRVNHLAGYSFALQNLSSAQLGGSTLTSANFAGANLSSASLDASGLTGANFTGASVAGADFSHTTSITNEGFTATQFYSTASHQNRDLTGIRLSVNNLTNWNFASQNLSSAELGGSTLTSANFVSANLSSASLRASVLTATNFTGASVAGADFSYSGFTATQLYSTASYQNRDLTGIRFRENNLTNWNFASQNLSSAILSYCTLNSANFIGAAVSNADFSSTTSRGFTADQLYSTASYHNRDLTGIRLTWNDLTGWNFMSADLTSADLEYTVLTATNFSLADLRSARFFMPDTTTITRGTLLPNGSLSPFTFSPGETLRIRQHPVYPATSDGTIAGPANGTATIALDPGASLDLAPTGLADASTRTLDNVALVLKATPTLPSVVRASTVTANASGRTLAPTTTILSSLSIAGDSAPLSSRTYYAFLDLGTNDAILKSTPLAEAHSMVRHWLTSANGLPGSTGLGSSAAFYTPEGAFTTLAVHDNSIPSQTLTTFNGIAVSPTDLLVKYTYLGDTNLDGLVDASDLSRLLQGMNGQGSGWNFGDVNYDGVVNFTDLGRTMAALRGQGAPLSGNGSGGGAPIPEPASLGILLAAAPLMGRRRR